MEVLVDDEIELPDITPSREKNLGKRKKLKETLTIVR